MDNLDNLHETITRFRNSAPDVEVGGDFENQVFAKIKKKKKQRKITTSVTVALVLTGFLFIAQATFLNKPTESRRPLLANTSASESEEIPVVEDVVFAASDSGSSYVIEQVGYSGDDNTL